MRCAWLWLVALFAERSWSQPVLSADKWSGCGEVVADAPLSFFQPCATSEWEVLLTDTFTSLRLARNVSALLWLPKSDNAQGCGVHPEDHFKGRIALLQRGGCYFSWKTVLAEEAGALAVIMYDTTEEQSTAVLAIAGPFQNPRIAAYLISREEGTSLRQRVENGEDVEVLCSWSPVEVWFNLPDASPEFNDTLTLENVGDEDMAWVMDVIDTNVTFEQDPFFSASVVPAPPPFSSGGAPGGVEELDNEAELMPLPFPFPHYLEYHDSAFVSCNGALILDPVLDEIWNEITRQAAVLGSGIGPHDVVAAMWADMTCPKEVNVSAFHSRSADSLGVKTVAIRYEGLLLKSPAIGPFGFEVWLHSDGRILLLLEEFPVDNLTALAGIQVGVQPATGAKALSVGASLPWSSGAPLAVSLTPWFMLRENGNTVVAPNQSLTITFAFERQADLAGWLHFYAEKSVGTWHPRRNVRFTQRLFRFMWVLSAWDGGLHSGSCAGGFVRRRNRTCAGSDGREYNDTYCIGTCMDIDPVQNYDYPVKQSWTDGYNNQCEDYHVLNFCTPTGYGARWQKWWGYFADWTTSGMDAGDACCLCGGGTYTPELPITEEKCPSVNCPANSQGTSVLHGCVCDAGYMGVINASDEYPYFVGTCATVSCPKYSSGSHVAAGCTCDYGYLGTIVPTSSEPFYEGRCEATTTTTSSTWTETTSTQTISSTTTSFTTTRSTTTTSHTTTSRTTTTSSSSTSASSSTTQSTQTFTGTTTISHTTTTSTSTVSATSSTTQSFTSATATSTSSTTRTSTASTTSSTTHSFTSTSSVSSTLSSISSTSLTATTTSSSSQTRTRTTATIWTTTTITTSTSSSSSTSTWTNSTTMTTDTQTTTWYRKSPGTSIAGSNEYATSTPWEDSDGLSLGHKRITFASSQVWKRLRAASTCAHHKQSYVRFMNSVLNPKPYTLNPKPCLFHSDKSADKERLQCTGPSSDMQ
ncbi:unnamed protein product [Symbiodinium natans]|uniref:PA domain-containing protein n=1 Tax=Symbiodinium natans TaxID=878477 RepID=A0A812UP60_9DINO|nr:unnamed protein product [Symbiodinium natans]